jgi:hypothetical protein
MLHFIIRHVYVPLPRGMSAGFYAFMRPGCVRDESGEVFMTIERPATDQRNVSVSVGVAGSDTIPSDPPARAGITHSVTGPRR